MGVGQVLKPVCSTKLLNDHMILCLTNGFIKSFKADLRITVQPALHLLVAELLQVLSMLLSPTLTALKTTDFTSLEAHALTASDQTQISSKCPTLLILATKMVWFQLPSAINAVILIITVIINGSPLLRPIGKPPSFSVTRLEAARSALPTTSPTSQP